MIYKILVPSGIGDFSWLWSKLSITGDQYHIEYIGGKPDRMSAFLKLLPKDKILSFKPNDNYATRWNDKGELVCYPKDASTYPGLHKMQRYSDLKEGQLMFAEVNSRLEAGHRLEGWLSNEIPNTEFHYKIAGILEKWSKGNCFIVNFSSYGTKKAWGYYDVPVAASLVEFIVMQTDWTPLFIGGEYDDFTSDIHAELLRRGIEAISLVGRTPSLKTVIALIQQSNLYFGACSGLMVISNILRVPVCAYYPPFEKPPGRHLAVAWHDEEVPYMSLFWEGFDKDISKIYLFLDRVWKETGKWGYRSR